MDVTKKYKAQLDALDRENKQAVLRAIAGSDYKKELHRTQIQEKLRG